MKSLAKEEEKVYIEYRTVSMPGPRRGTAAQTEEDTMKHTRWGISLAADVSAPRKA